jgi:hypothetical protein
VTGDEALEMVAGRLGEIRRELGGHGWRVRFFGRADLEPVGAGPIETAPPDPAAVAELRSGGLSAALAASMSSPTGNVCPACSFPTVPNGGCERCPNCGQTSSCG